jgi:hypothetical protein
MKIISIVLLSVLITFAGYSQVIKKSEVPEIVKGKFWFNIPETSDTIQFPVTWEKSGANFKGSVVINDYPASMIFDNAGNLLKSVRRVNLQYLPEKIAASLKNNYPESDVNLILKIIDKDGKETYQLSLNVVDFYSPEGVKTTGKKESTTLKKSNDTKKK